MAFEFRFKALQQHREILLKKAQVALASALQKQLDLKARKESLRAEIAELCGILEAKQTVRIRAAEYVCAGEYMRHLEQSLLELDVEIRIAVDEVSAARKVLLNSEKDLKVTEVLEERDWETYRYRQARHDQKQADEIAGVGDYQKRKKC